MPAPPVQPLASSAKISSKYPCNLREKVVNDACSKSDRSYWFETLNLSKEQAHENSFPPAFRNALAARICAAALCAESQCVDPVHGRAWPRRVLREGHT